ncbi:MAG: diaminopimelate decarboxylase [Firmicutes bacterium]|nr:diaminopimelate decarboxylase [Bacillota bacterium]
MIHSNITVSDDGHLCFAGRDTVQLAEKYGTPLMLIDEDRVRERASTYVAAMREYFGEGSAPLYASKALSCVAMYKIVGSEGMSVDVVSSGELYTALKAGFPAERIYFHGNNKTADDVRYGLDSRIGYFVADNLDEVERISVMAGERGMTQPILLRLTPGIDPHTNEKISTGKVDSKFGTAIETGQAEQLIARVLTMPGIKLCGFHCHVGSQVFDQYPFCDAADIMIDFMAHIEQSLGYRAEILNLGGGFGVRYVDSDPYIDIRDTIRLIAEHINNRCAEHGMPVPRILMEPGRSIVADSGMTVYTVGSVKTIAGYKSYVAIDGGMTDNPRYTLYGSKYTVYNASRADAPADFKCTVAGRCCESGDLIAEGVSVARPQSGDKLAVAVTGAYNYSMASNYNRVPRPPIVALRGGADRVIVRRETYADMVACDIDE